MRRAHLLLALACSTLLASCTIKRTITVTSDPPGAQVRLDETVIGRTPLEYEFTHYGRRRITLYLGGYLTHSQPVDLTRPWYAAFPLDLITEFLLPLRIRDRRSYHATLEPDSEDDDSFGFGPMLRRAESVRARYREQIEELERGAAEE